MNIRNWAIAGSVCGVLSIALFGALLGHAISGPAEPSAVFDLSLVATLMLGVASICVLVGAGVAHHIAQEKDRYIEGVRETVDRLADALPGSTVRRIDRARVP